jgi:hypothetical protein
MSGGIAVKDESRRGVSPRLHKQSAEAWGDDGCSRRASLKAWGPQAPMQKNSAGERSEIVALGMCRGQSRPAKKAKLCRRTKRKRSPKQPGPNGQRPKIAFEFVLSARISLWTP